VRQQHPEIWTTDPTAAREVLRDLLGSVGEDTVMRPPLYVDWGVHIHVGRRTFVTVALVALDVAQVSIGHDLQIGPKVQLLTPLHPIEPEPRRHQRQAARAIVIGLVGRGAC
jgi:maltose O-acetyltransferase